MAVVLAVIGTAVYVRFGDHLDDTLEQGLRARAGDISALIQRADNGRAVLGGVAGLAAPGRSVLHERDDSFAQVLTADGSLLDGSPKLRAHTLLPRELVARAARTTLIVTRPNPFERDEPARLLATPVTANGRSLVVVVGVDAGDRDSQLASLARLLLISSPIALLLASLAGYRVASSALAPVEAMRRKAERITAENHGQRLPIGRADDEIARLGETLNGMLARLELAVERERAFVADASHELRTPLAILKTEIELALGGERSDEELRAALRSASEETDRLVELAEAMLVLARADGGKFPLARAEVDTARLFDGAALRFASRAREAGRELIVDGGHPQGLIADPDRLAQALDNLVENALQHGAGTIRLSSTARDDMIELHVSDAGPGFPPGFLAQAFDRFTRADHARARGGSGLGLSIVRLIARAHGGDAHAANDPAGGACVTIELPVARSSDQ